MPTDVFTVTQTGTRVLSFMSQAIGLMSELDLGTEHLRFMGDTYVSLTPASPARSPISADALFLVSVRPADTAASCTATYAVSCSGGAAP